MVFETQDLARLAAAAQARGRRLDRRQLLGQPDLSAAARAWRRPRGAFRLEVSGRPQRRGRGRGLRPARADLADRCRRLPAARRQAVAVRRLAAGARPAHPALAHAPPPRQRARDRTPARRATRRCAGSTIPCSATPAPVSPPCPGPRGSSPSSWIATRPASPGFCDALRLFKLGVSWGGHESLAFPAAAGLVQKGPANPLAFFGVSPATVRLHIGLEDPEDLWSDLRQALDA